MITEADIQRCMAAATELHAVTREECDTQCRSLSPYKCCSPEYCDMVLVYAKHLGIEPPPETGHPTLKFMGADGCVAPLWMRGPCTAHACALGTYGSSMPPGWMDRWYAAHEKLNNALEALAWQAGHDYDAEINQG